MGSKKEKYYVSRLKFIESISYMPESESAQQRLTRIRSACKSTIEKAKMIED